MITKFEASALKKMRNLLPQIEVELDDVIRNAIIEGKNTVNFSVPNEAVGKALMQMYRGHFSVKLEFDPDSVDPRQEIEWTLIISDL